MQTIRKFDGKNHYLHNDFPRKVMYDGVLYESATHAFIAARTLNLRDRALVAEAKTPEDAGKIKNCIKEISQRKDFEKNGDKLMLQIVMNKFLQNPDLAVRLMKTDGMDLIFENTTSTYWGKPNGNGKNRFGQILMEVRDMLIQIEKQRGLYKKKESKNG